MACNEKKTEDESDKSLTAAALSEDHLLTPSARYFIHPSSAPSYQSASVLHLEH